MHRRPLTPPSTVTSRGIADDGAEVEIVIPATESATLAARWPPLGLRRHDPATGEPGTSAARRLSIHTDPPDGEAQAFVDGLPSPGGWERLESELALFATERLSGLVAVHAAVIAEEAGGPALLVPGPSGAGKSSLCVAAAEAGALVLSDEFALVDPVTGRVTGWDRPVRVRRPEGGVDRITLATSSTPVDVGLIALVTYEPETSEHRWEAIGAAEAVVGLLANTVCARSRPDESLDAALAIARTVHAVAGVRGEAAEALGALFDLVQQGSQAG